MTPIERFRDADTAVQIAVAFAVLVGAGITLVVLVTALAIGVGVLGTFALGVGDSTGQGLPQVSWQFEETLDGIRITHGGGDSVRTARLAVEIDGTRRAWSEFDHEGDRAVEIGDEITVFDPGSGTIRLLYDAPEDETFTLATYEV